MDEEDIRWIPASRNYHRERNRYSLVPSSVSSHPLETKQTKDLTSRNAVSNGSPLTKSASSNSIGKSVVVANNGTFFDPLSAMAEENGLLENSFNVKSTNTARRDVLGPWAAKKEFILSRFTTTAKLTLSSSYLSADDRSVSGNIAGQVSGRIQSRLEQLDNFDSNAMKEVKNLSQQDFVSRIDQLHAKLQTAWREDQRVTALKMAIQLAKLLSDTTPLQFYPSKFVLVSDVLETFGQLIYDRIEEKSGIVNGDKRSNSDAEAAKETCRNWFFKVASIRELLPRLYVEMSIMRCCSFLEKDPQYSDTISRFTNMIRGIGNPLVASYARCYLARMVLQVAPHLSSQLFRLIEDFSLTTNQLRPLLLGKMLQEDGMTVPSYISLHQPAVEWIFECWTTEKKQEILSKALTVVESSQLSGLLINSLLTTVKAEVTAKDPLRICAVITKNNQQLFPNHVLCRTFGQALLNADIEPKIRRKLLKEIWTIIVAEPEPSHYMFAVEPWIEFVAKYFTTKEVNRMLGDIIEHLQPDRAYEKYSVEILETFKRITKSLRSFPVLISMEKLMPFLAMLNREEDKVAAAKHLLEFFMRFEKTSTSDPVTINGMMFGCKVLHDSVSSLSSDDERRFIAALISDCLSRVDYGTDFEEQLSFYATCRAQFINLDDVAEFLVRRVNNLAMRAHQIQKGLHTRKTAAFVRACIAFSFITIPSLYDVPAQLNLSLETAEVALMNQCLGQADALVKQSVQLFNVSKDSLEQFATKTRPASRFAVEFIGSLLSLMIVLPDPPEVGMLYLARGVLNSILNCSRDVKPSLQIQFLVYLSAISQEDYIYHVEGIDSNDRLYGPDPKFAQESETMASLCFSDLLSTFEELKSSSANQAVKLGLDILDLIVSHGNVLALEQVLKRIVPFLKTHRKDSVGRLENLVRCLKAKFPGDDSSAILSML